MLEVIRPVVGEEGRYEVSNYGRVWSLLYRDRRPRLLKGTIGKSGYCTIDLRERGQQTGVIRTVHSMVAQAFLPNPCNLPIVQHKDKVKIHNEVSNLEWCTRQRNAEHATARTYEFVSPVGLLQTVYNLRRFCRDNNLNTGGLHGVHTGRLSAHKGWTRAVQLQ